MRERWRLVTVQNGRRHVSSVVLNEDEAIASVIAEVEMHEATGWTVERGARRMAAISPDRRVIRTVRAECFDAFDDHPC